MIKFEFDAPDMNSLIQRAIQQHLAASLASVTCPTHGGRLEAVHIAGDAPDRLDIQMKGCCDEILSLASDALGTSDEEGGGLHGGGNSEMDANAAAGTDRTPRAFICHASEDKELARRLANDLHSAGIDTFFDEWEMKAGDSLRRKIDEGIEACTHFIVLLTPLSLEKPWVNAELDAGFVKKVEGQSILIPLRQGLGVDRLPALLRALISPEIREYEQDVKRLIGDIRGLTRKPPVSSTATREPLWGPNLALSPLAATVAELFAKRSEHGRAFDPQLSVTDMKEASQTGDNDLIDAISELEDLGWIKPPESWARRLSAMYQYHRLTTCSFTSTPTSWRGMLSRTPCASQQKS